MQIAIVTDSTSDIPEDLAREHNIHIIRNIVVIEGQSLEDGKGISRQEFYQRLPNMKTLPTTATASAGVYQELYDLLLRKGADHIVSIHASAKLSGIFNAASLAAQSFAGKVTVFDSHMITLGLGFQALAAAEATAGGITPEKLVALLENLRQRARVVAMLDTLEYIRRSGRVSWARSQLGGLLRIKLFVEVREGLVHRLGEVRTRRKGIERLLMLAAQQGPMERLALLHTNAEAEARQILETLNLALAYPPLIINVTTVIGTHVGPNGLGFAGIVR